MDVAFAYFGEVARLGSIRKAGERLHVSASSISRQIMKLEREFGTKLLVRHARGIKLTDAGRIVDEFIRSRSREVQRLKAAIDDLRNLQCGHVIIYTVEGMLGGFLPRALSDVASRHPGLSYDIIISGTDDVMEAVAEDRCDIGISFNPYPRPDVETIAAFRQPLLAVLAPDHPLANRRTLTLKALEGVPVGLPDKTFGIRHMVDLAAKATSARLTIRVETNSIDMVRQFALHRMGVSFLPAFAFERELSAGMLVGIPLQEAGLSRATTQICKHIELDLTYAAQYLNDAIIRALGA